MMQDPTGHPFLSELLTGFLHCRFNSSRQSFRFLIPQNVFDDPAAMATFQARRLAS